jgi:hypothetical protein
MEAMDYLLRLDQPQRPFPQQLYLPHANQTPWSICQGYAGSFFLRPSHVRLAKGSISGAISHVCQTFREHGQPNPSLDDNSKTGFLLQQELRAFKKADPAKKHQKAIPMLVISALAKQQLSELDQAIVQLTGLGVFFAFRSCKYLKVSQAPLKDKSWIWQNYFRLQIKLICILYNYLFLLGNFVVLTKINCSLFCFLINV